MSTARELQSPCCAAWLTSLSDSKLGKSSLITVSYQHSNRCEVRPANNNPPIIAIIETKTGNILIWLDHWRIAGGNCGLIHQENKYWQITWPWAAIRACPIALNGPKLLFDHKLCLLELSWSWSTHVLVVRKSLVVQCGPRHLNTIYHPGGGSLRRC